VYFRISETEYKQIESIATSVYGARSVSEFARAAVRKMLDSPQCQANGLEYHLTVLCGVLQALTLRLTEMHKSIAELQPLNSNDSALGDRGPGA
jgi:hypothetical protein